MSKGLKIFKKEVFVKKKFVLALLSVVLISMATAGMVSADGDQWWKYPHYNDSGSWNQNCWNGNYWNCGYQNPCYGWNCYKPAPSLCGSFVSDVTIPDKMYIAPGTAFTKTWRIRNAGNVTWNTGYQLVFSSGNQMSGPSSVSLPYNVAPGQTIDISVNLVAPNYGGTFKGNWILRSDTGQIFGVGASCQVAVWVEITTAQTWNYNNCGYNNYYNCYPQCYGYSCNQNRPRPPYQPDPWPNWP